MESPESTIPSTRSPSEGGQFAWQGFLLAIVVAPLFGLIWASLAEGVQAYFAPLVLFPLLVGTFAGLSVIGFVRFAHIGHRPTILLAAVLAAAVAGTAQHGFGYLSTYYWARPPVGPAVAPGVDLSGLLQEIRPSFGEYMAAQAQRGRPLLMDYMAQGWAAWLSWVIDLLLVIVGAIAVTIPAMRVPYCNRCRTWYRTIRNGKIDQPTALRIAELVGVDEVEHPRSPRYRLSACEGGCGPTRCELSWEESDGAIALVRAWLDPAARNEVAAVLDGLESKEIES